MQEHMIEQNIVITESSRNLRALGRNALKDKWKISIIAVCVYLIVMELPPIVFDALFGTNVGSMFTNNGYTYGMDAETYAQFYNNMPEYSLLSLIYIILVTGALELGLTIFFLAVFRRHDVHVTDIFLGFEKFGKALGLYLFQSLFIFLWSLLFVIPGIVAAFRYSQAFFILADDPTKGIRQCMNESKAMMRGNKWKYFCLSLSFIGWGLLCSIPSGIFSSIGTVVSNNDFVIAIFAIIGGLFVAPVMVYMFSTVAGFYEILAGHLIKETKPVPVTIEEAKQQMEEAQEAAREETEETAEEETAEEDSEETTEKEPVNLLDEIKDAIEGSADEAVEETTEEAAEEAEPEEKKDLAEEIKEALEETPDEVNEDEQQ